MLQNSKSKFAVFALIIGLTTFACTDDEQKVEEVIQPSVPAETEPPVDDTAFGETFTVNTLYFAFDDYTLNMDAQNELQGLANHLKSNQTAVVQIEGHCDERGSIEYNLALGERRAQSVKNYLVQLGVEAARISTISYGEEKPASEGHDESAWSRNRRAEFTITNQ